jgi:hypothetical protein
VGFGGKIRQEDVPLGASGLFLRKSGRAGLAGELGFAGEWQPAEEMKTACLSGELWHESCVFYPQCAAVRIWLSFCQQASVVLSRGARLFCERKVD